jgi:signal transduction histidine kinase
VSTGFNTVPANAAQPSLPPNPEAGGPESTIERLIQENADLNRKVVQLTQAAAANRAKDRFLATLSHELRDPLAPIRNSVALLDRAGAGDPVVHQAKEIINRQVSHMTRLIDDLLDASRLAQGRIVLAREEIDLAGLVEAVAASHQRHLEGAGVRLEVTVPVVPVRVSGDTARLAQVVDRLLENAARFTPSGGRVAVTLEPEAGGQAVLAVQDSGSGMDASTLSSLFEPYVRDAAPSRGAGLGLSLVLVKGLVDLHGGAITAHSEGHGLGSRFTLRLPMVQAPAPAPPAPVPLAAAARARRILIVEDLSDAAITMELLLEMLGHTVEAAADGLTGLDKAIRFQPEVILCDIGLPGRMDGYGVAQSVRATPSLAGVHLIALTGFNAPEDKERARRAGFDLHLTKPVDPAALERLLDALPDRRSDAQA